MHWRTKLRWGNRAAAGGAGFGLAIIATVAVFGLLQLTARSLPLSLQFVLSLTPLFFWFLCVFWLVQGAVAQKQWREVHSSAEHIRRGLEWEISWERGLTTFEHDFLDALLETLQERSQRYFENPRQFPYLVLEQAAQSMLMGGEVRGWTAALWLKGRGYLWFNPAEGEAGLTDLFYETIVYPPAEQWEEEERKVNTLLAT